MDCRVKPGNDERDSGNSYSAAAASFSRRFISARPVALTVHPRVTEPMPPSTTISWPLTKLDASLARNTAARAMSSGNPARGIGCSVAKLALRRSVTLSAFEPSMPAFLAKMPVTISAGDKRVDPDAFFAEFGGRRARQRMHRAFGG